MLREGFGDGWQFPGGQAALDNGLAVAEMAPVHGRLSVLGPAWWPVRATTQSSHVNLRVGFDLLTSTVGIPTAWFIWPKKKYL